jgi:hypothetical protein
MMKFRRDDKNMLSKKKKKKKKWAKIFKRNGNEGRLADPVLKK